MGQRSWREPPRIEPPQNRPVTTDRNALIIHAVGVPVFFAAVSARYFVRYGYTTPLVTAVTFTGFVVVVDFLLVALVILCSLEMFVSPLGTWIPFALIFASTWATGRYVTWRRGSVARQHARAGVERNVG